MKISTLLKFVRIVLPLMLLMACGVEPESSETDALTNATLACADYPAAQLQQLQNDINQAPGFFKNFSAAEQNTLLKHFQAVPPVYRNKLLSLKKAGSFRGIDKRPLQNGVLGQCVSTGNGPIEISISANYGNAISYALIHEVGHGVEGMIQRAAGKTNRDWDTIMRAFMQEAQGHNRKPVSRGDQVRDYAFASPAEFFAESFHNYYCSPQTHSFIQKNLPKTYAFLKGVLAAPVWAQNGNQPTQPTQPTPPTQPTTPTQPGNQPLPDAPGGIALQERANLHVKVILQAYNAKSKTCDLNLKSMGNVETKGDFVFDISPVLANGTTLATQRLITNFNNQLPNELADLDRLIPGLFPNCPN